MNSGDAMKYFGIIFLASLIVLSCRHGRDKQPQEPVETGEQPKSLDPTSNPSQGISEPIEKEKTPAPSTTDSSVPRQRATPMEGQLWILPQNGASFQKLPTNHIFSVWATGSSLLTTHPGVGLAISKNQGATWTTKTVGNGLGGLFAK